MTSVAKDFHRLMKRVGKLTDGQATISDIDWDDGNLQKFQVTLRPNSGLYKNGKFKFQLTIPDEYPEIPPAVWCHTEIYHPNIDPTEENYDDSSTNVCLNLLDNDVWKRSYGLEGTVLGLLFLMHNPNLEDPLSPYFEGADNEEVFKTNVQKYMAGEEFDDLSLKTDFCVRDGILIEQENSDANEADNTHPAITQEQMVEETETNDSEKDTECKTEDDATVEKAENDPECNSTAVTNTPYTSGCDNDTDEQSKDLCKDLENVTFDTNAVLNVEEVNAQGNGEDVTDDEDDSLEIKLLNIDGESVLIHCNMDEFDAMKQIAKENIESELQTDSTEPVDNGAMELNTTNTNNSTEVKIIDSETLCNIEADQNVHVNVANQVNSNENETRDNDDVIDTISVLDKPTCTCLPRLTVRNAIFKIINIIVRHKLYKDISI